ncbi:MAG: tetratricopeptide repeat protein [Pyrinomonadaceae bacterium]|nr:tetratricopeptide repeat protein [Pyrinomonadaceae bacterium]
MLTRSMILISLILLSSTWLLAQQLDPPKLTPAPSTEQQESLINKGVALHDQANYDGAIMKYEEVLKENPSNVLAMYEMAFSYSMKKDYAKSLEMAYQGAQYKSDHLTGFYLMIGNNLDLLGEPNKAVNAYKAGIKLEPTASLLYYNLAITYTNLKKPDDAKKSLKQAVILNPNHPSSHLALGTLFYRTDYKTPALFAVSRFLILEPKTERSIGAYKVLQEILRGGVREGKNPNEINIFVSVSSKKDEGDFGSIDMVMGLSRAAGMTEKNKGKSEMQLLVDQLDSLFSIISEIDPKGDRSKFVWKHYLPYFIELKKRDFVEPFGYYISQRSNVEGVEDWLWANRNRVNAFLNWSKQYPWPKID